MVRRPLISLFYHTVSDDPLPHVAPLYATKDIATFEADLAWIDGNLRPVDHATVAAHRLAGKPLPEDAVEISFDDGFEECHSVVRSLLLRYGIPATFYVIANCVDNKMLMHRNRVALCLDRLDALSEGQLERRRQRLGAALGTAATTAKQLRRAVDELDFGDNARVDAVCEILDIDVASFLRMRRPYLTREQICQLARDGFTIGAHTLNHPRLHQLPWDAVRREVLESCSWVRDLTGAERFPFAIPFNGLELDRGRLARLREEDGSMSLIYDTNNLMQDADFVVNRIWADSPRGAGGGSNIPALLCKAHLLEPLRVLRRKLTF
jgi:peptidoglycan/xylan/chitin deacetylase (PgdA/CDA1 family)